MCGFVAVVRPKGHPTDSGLLRSMADRISHRGPDAEGRSSTENLDFFHKRLSIIDLASGDQPMSREDVTLVFNGEIYNYVELREDLARRGHTFTTESDTEVLLRCYLEHGVGFVSRLNGMFAFVLHDERNHRVLAARDHFGIKPLYRACTGDRLIYASEIKALLPYPDVRSEVDHEALGQYITFQHTLGEKTLFSGIEKVMPAHFELVDPDTARLSRCERYWKPEYSIDHRLSEQSAVEQLRELIRVSVHRQLRSDVPLGAYLSGGLDSSTVTVLAAREYGGGLKTFTGAFREGAEFDESGYAEDVAGQVGAEQFLVYPTEREFVDSLSMLSYAMDEPAAGPGLFPQYMVSRLASENVKVCLGGQGGDEMFGGYARYLIAYLEMALTEAIDPDSTTSGDNISLEALASQLPMLRQYRPMLKRFFGKDMFADPARRYFHLVDRSAGVLDVMAGDIVENYDPEAIYADFRETYDLVESDSYLNRITGFDLMASLPALLHVEDRVSMAVSLESRVPLLDPDIMKFTATVPPALKWRNGEPKYLFKKAVEPWLPQSVVRRTDKMGFPVPLHLWAQGEAREFVADTLLSQRSVERGLYKTEAVKELIDHESAFGRGLWAMLQLELWHQNFIDNQQDVYSEGEKHASVVQ